MPQGKGTYGSRVGKPPKKKPAAKAAPPSAKKRSMHQGGPIGPTYDMAAIRSMNSPVRRGHFRSTATPTPTRMSGGNPYAMPRNLMPRQPRSMPAVNTRNEFLMRGHRAVRNPNYIPPTGNRATQEFIRMGHSMIRNPNYDPRVQRTPTPQIRGTMLGHGRLATGVSVGPRPTPARLTPEQSARIAATNRFSRLPTPPRSTSARFPNMGPRPPANRGGRFGRR